MIELPNSMTFFILFIVKIFDLPIHFLKNKNIEKFFSCNVVIASFRYYEINNIHHITMMNKDEMFLIKHTVKFTAILLS